MAIAISGNRFMCPWYRGSLPLLIRPKQVPNGNTRVKGGDSCKERVGMEGVRIG